MERPRILDDIKTFGAYKMRDIENMPRNEWLNYRDELLNEWQSAGNVLRPNIECRSCNPSDDYTCLICEIDQVGGEVKHG